MNKSIHSLVRTPLALAFAAIALLTATSSLAAAPVVLQFTASAANTTANILTLNDPHLNGKPTLKLIVTQDISYAAIVFNPHPIGIYYNTSTKTWEIFNEDITAMPPGAIFNVLIPTTAARVNGGATNSFTNQTFFTLRKHDASALLLQTHVFDPFPHVTTGPLNGVFQLSPVGLFFNPVVTTPPVPSSSGCWDVFNEDVGPALATSYNIADVTKAGTAAAPFSFIFTTTAANITGDLAEISNSLTNSKPNAVLFANHISTTAEPVYDKFYAVVYYTPSSRWGIATEDGSTMPVGVSFVITAYPSVTP
jgi:hypothetical protein